MSTTTLQPPRATTASSTRPLRGTAAGVGAGARTRDVTGVRGVRAGDGVGRVGLLALAAPLLLFVHGIFAWLDSVSSQSGRGGLAGTSAPATTLEYAAGSLGAAVVITLVASVALFAWLAAEILRHPSLSQRLSVGNMVVAGLGVVVVALPFELLPLGALLVLIGLAPLMRADDDRL